MLQGIEIYNQEQVARWRSLVVVAFFIPAFAPSSGNPDDMTGYLSSVSTAGAKCLSLERIPDLTKAADCISGELAKSFPSPRGVVVTALISTYCSAPQGRIVEDCYTLPEIVVQNRACFSCVRGEQRKYGAIIQILILPHAF